MEAGSNEVNPQDGAWDEALATELLDRIVLAGLTFVDQQDEVVEQEQFWGKIVCADRDRGIQIELRGVRTGSDYWLLPDTGSFNRADAGEYKLRTTGELVVNPDFISTWTITRPSH